MTDDDLELSVAWRQHLGTSAVAGDWFDVVMARHRETHRHYHNVRHVRWVVRHVIELDGAGHVDDTGAVVAAAFFHDVVYDPVARDNESVSARLATRALTDLGWADDRSARVGAMIEATATHVATDNDEAALIAADLAVLAAEPGPYGDYTRAVRREYDHVSDDDWRTGRASVLRSFLDRDHIFEPSLGIERWERRARANITSELAVLGR